MPEEEGKQKDAETLQAEMVVSSCMKTEEGRALLKYFIDISIGYTFSTDAQMQAYTEGRRYHGKRFLQIIQEQHAENLSLVLTNGEYK